ncbi:hypothetical protein psyc5s11_29800 [Clostridium gelidum]|uniref:Uncharacterized protein n=1 Tax=Clostridium gelidum TaxID=704125 RepID=A0ABN6J181_9CLOT|nr:cobalt ABC transporter permease [Clostridium gelidum]BCZ46913.1 hypothetical protein psyc5s11_29800 [Clostridium gelidum]
MKELLISQIAPILNTAIIAILIVVIKTVGKPAIELFAAKKKEAELKIIASGHESDLKKSLEVWNIVDDKWRITKNAVALFKSKEALFEQLLLQRIPGLTQQNINDLRDTISGEVNKGKAVLTQDTIVQQLADLQQTNATLQAENQNLKTTINQISSAIEPVVINNITASDVATGATV